MKFQRGDIWSIKLYPVRGSEQDGVRPCLILSPDTMNKSLKTLVVAPLTRSQKDWPTRVNVKVKDDLGQVCLEHIRSVSKERLLKKICKTSAVEFGLVSKHLVSMFSL